MPTLRREAFLLALAHLFSALAGLAAVRLLTEIATPEVYGLAWLFINGSGFAVMVLARPVGQVLNRFYHDANGPEHLDPLLSLVWRLHFGVILGTSVIYLGFTGLFGGFATTAWPSFVILPFYFFFLSFFSTAEIFLNTARRRGSRTLLTLAEAFLRPLCAVSLCLLWKPTVNAFVLGYALSSLIPGTIGMALLWKAGSRWPALLPAPSRDLTREAVGYALPWVGFTICIWILALSDRYLIAGIADTASVGTYVAAYQVGSAPFQFLGGVFAFLVQPLIFQSAAVSESRAAEGVGASLELFAWISFPLLAGFLALHYWLMKLLVAANYLAGGLSTVVWIGLGAYLLFAGDLARNVFLVRKRMGPPLVIYSATALLNIGLNLLLIPSMGIKGAGVATFAAYALYTLGMIIWGRRELPWSVPLRSIAIAGGLASAAAIAAGATHRLVLGGAQDFPAGIAVLAAFGGTLIFGGFLFRRSWMGAIRRLETRQAGT